MKYQNKSRLYEYYLRNSSFGTIQLYSAPDGWKNDGYVFSRSEKYYGMFRERSDLTLKFKKEARRFLIKVLSAEGIEGSCEFIVKKYDFTTYEYADNFTGVVDFSTKGKNRKSFDVKVIDSSFAKQIRVREDIPIKLFDLVSIDGFLIPGFTNEGVEILLPSRTDKYFNRIGSFDTEDSINTFAVPFQYGAREDESIINVVDKTDILTVDGAFLQANRDTTVFIEGTGDYLASGLVGIGDFVLTLKKYNQAGALQSSNVLSTTSIVNDAFVDVSYSIDIAVNENDYLICEASFSGVTGLDSFRLYIDQNTNTIYQEVSDQNCVGFMRFESFTRILQSITGIADPFRSEKLGRTDSEPQAYASDGDGSLVLKTNGRLIRQFPKESTPLAISLSELFQSVSSTDFVGLGLETIDGSEKVVCEDINYFFDERVILTIDNAKDISFEFAQDYIFNSIKSGYSKLAYETKDGILEYNNKSQWSTFIKSVKNELNIVSNIRGDNAGINFARLKDYVNHPTEDTKYDEDNFLIDLFRGTNLILNGKFVDWTGNTPDNWTILTGGFLEKTYLGNSRCRFNSLTPDGIVNTASITQSVSVNLGDIISVSLVYKFVSEIPITGVAGLTIEVGGYKLKPDGSWDNTYPGTVKDFIESSVTEAQLQSFESFSLISDSIPISGTLSIKFGTLTAGFVIDDVLIGDSYMTARTNEGFDSITGTVNNEKSLNIRYSPARILMNWGAMIRAGLDNYDGSFVVYNKSDKNSNLVSKETGEDEVTENANVRVSDLDEPRIRPEYITFDAPVNSELIQTINDNWAADGKPKKYGIVKVKDELTDDYYYGWIIQINSEAVEKSVPFRLLMVNTNKLTPVE